MTAFKDPGICARYVCARAADADCFCPSATRDVAAALPPDARGWLLRQAKVDTEDGATIMFAPSTPDGAAQSGPFQRRSSKFCKYCNVHQPINSVHCQDCGVCVRGYERAAPCTSEVCACVCVRACVFWAGAWLWPQLGVRADSMCARVCPSRRRLDHHCPWTGKCIGQGNLPFFHGFLCGLLALIIAFIVMTVQYATDTGGSNKD